MAISDPCLSNNTITHNKMILLKNVSKTLGDFHLHDINLEIYENEYLVILGPTGTGKTVILETIAGLYEPDTGSIELEGISVCKKAPEERNIGFVYQEYALFPHLTVKDNIIFGLKVKKQPKDYILKELSNMVELLGIKHLLSRYPSTLSGGEQQRVAIARALITKPRVLLLDEPLSALDPGTKENFQYELKQIHHRIKTTTIHITHDFTEAHYLADRICVMHQGRIVQVGTPEEIFSNPCSDFVAGFVGMDNFFTGNSCKEKKGIQVNDVFLQVRTQYNGKVWVGIRPENISIHKCPIPLHEGQFGIHGIIEEINPKGSQLKLRISGELPLTALVLKQNFTEQGLGVKSNIFAVIEMNEIHVISAAHGVM